MLHKIILSFLGFFLSFQASFADLKSDIVPGSGEGVLQNVDSSENLLDSILAYVRDSIFGLLALISIGVFLYIGFKLVTARGNPEEFKKALNTLIYAVVGIFLVSFAWAAVKLIAGLNI